MKNLILATLLSFITILQLSATNSPTSNVQVLELEKAVVLNLTQIAVKANSFTVINSDDEVVFTEALKNYDQGVKFKLANLPTGKYTIQVEGDNFIELYKANITQDLLSIESIETHNRPSLTEMDDKITVDATLTDDENILVTIFDAKSGDLVYDYRDSKMGEYQKTFNLKQLKKGTYNVVVSTGYFNESSRITL